MIIMSEQKTILVIGSSGQLGQSMYSVSKHYPNFKFIFANKLQIDLKNNLSIERYLNELEFDVLINCAAYTEVDKAESEFLSANQINHIAIKKIAELIYQKRKKLIHISTDYVFDGKKVLPYSENDKTNPMTIYGKTKLDGEKSIKRILNYNSIIIRTSWLYSEYGKNFLNSIIKLGNSKNKLNVVCDQFGSPTYAIDLSNAIMAIIKSDQFFKEKFKSEIFHFSNKGIISWYDFAKKIFEITKIQCEVIPIDSKDYSSIANRPKYSALENKKIQKIYGIHINEWKNSLSTCLKNVEINL
jgi:dTDP-4-dehydrorhamnose reductase